MEQSFGHNEPGFGESHNRKDYIDAPTLRNEMGNEHSSFDDGVPDELRSAKDALHDIYPNVESAVEDFRNGTLDKLALDLRFTPDEIEELKKRVYEH